MCQMAIHYVSIRLNYPDYENNFNDWSHLEKYFVWKEHGWLSGKLLLVFNFNLKHYFNVIDMHKSAILRNLLWLNPANTQLNSKQLLDEDAKASKLLYEPQLHLLTKKMTNYNTFFYNSNILKHKECWKKLAITTIYYNWLCDSHKLILHKPWSDRT